MDIEKLIDYLKNYQLWRRGAEMEQPDPVELGEKLDEAIQILKEGGVLHESHIEMQVPFDKCMRELVESRESHPLTTKEEADKQVAEFDKVQPVISITGVDKIFRETSANKCWREMRDVDAIEAERDKYKKAFEDLREWVKEEEASHGVIGDSGHNFGNDAYFNVLEKIEELIENK